MNSLLPYADNENKADNECHIFRGFLPDVFDTDVLRVIHDYPDEEKSYDPESQDTEERQQGVIHQFIMCNR